MNAGTNAEGAEKLQRAQREYGGERKRRRSYAEGAKRDTKICLEKKRLEPVFMWVAGHKWLGRRMGAGSRGFACLLCLAALLG